MLLLTVLCQIVGLHQLLTFYPLEFVIYQIPYLHLLVLLSKHYCSLQKFPRRFYVLQMKIYRNLSFNDLITFKVIKSRTIQCFFFNLVLQVILATITQFVFFKPLINLGGFFFCNFSYTTSLFLNVHLALINSLITNWFMVNMPLGLSPEGFFISNYSFSLFSYNLFK